MRDAAHVSLTVSTWGAPAAPAPGGVRVWVLPLAPPPVDPDELLACLTPDELATLIETAIHLQKQALEFRRDRRAWLPLAASVLAAFTAFAGSIIGAAIGK